MGGVDQRLDGKAIEAVQGRVELVSPWHEAVANEIGVVRRTVACEMIFGGSA
jgi:hypothetical protein